ncbi:tRNA U-34 5-methylaminomethyl-2-thiouridine biosynthesis protein [bacterium]|nr:tRNA U-34 5-methylaminomethyl-2-thiouridine biosynthesis protein [bacterium]
MKNSGRIVAGVLAPHPPHLVYAENPPQNEPRAECGWEELRWGYERLRKSLSSEEFDVILVHTPHWRTVVGHHMLGVPHFKGISVDPVFPHLFRYNYDLKVDVELAEAIAAEGKSQGLQTSLMRNPKFRVDYGTIISCHLTHPTWDKPIVSISSNAAADYFSTDVGQQEMIALGHATRAAIEKSGRKALLLSSCSLSHRHFTEEPQVPEDMTYEHIYNHNQYLWDMRMLKMMRAGESKRVIAEMPDFTDQAISETRAGSLTWLLAAMNFPTTPATVHAYGTVIGTGNAIVEWRL